MNLSPRLKILLALFLASGGGYVLYNFLKRKYRGKKGISTRIDVADIDPLDVINPKNKQKKEEKGLSRNFWRQLGELIRITIPRIRSKEVLLMSLILVFQVILTIVSNNDSRVQGELLRFLIDKNPEGFKVSFFQSIGLSFASSLLIPTLQWFQDSLVLQWRKRLTQKIHSEYYSDMTYYKVSYLDDRIRSPDQCITQDVESYAESAVDMYLKIIRPVIDVVYFTYHLIHSGGYFGPLAVTIYMTFSVSIIQLVIPNFGKMLAEKSEKEGLYRKQHARIKTHAEAIAVYNGQEFEKKVVDGYFASLMKQVELIVGKNLFFGVFYDSLFKYFPHTIVWLVLGLPVFWNRYSHLSLGELIREVKYVSAMIGSEFVAVANLLYMYRNMLNLSAYVLRVGNLLDVMKDLKTKWKKLDNIKEKDTIEFEKCSVVTPKGEVLATNLSFEVVPGKNTIILGPNGSGKSSLFRVLGTLWPLHEGTLYKPGGAKTQGLHESIFYIPQKPYNCIGSVRDQILYPTIDDGTIPDEKFTKILKMVHLNHLVQDKYELKMNFSTLSMGEQQKLAMARLFFHAPTYAILDECTSGITLDDEKMLYDTCKSLGITCITISHRPALYQYHDYELRFDGKGGTHYAKIQHQK